MFAFKKIDDNDYLYYILLVLFASCFHKSAFLMLPLLLVLKVPNNKITFVIGMFLLAFVFLFSEPLIQLVLSTGYYTIYVLSNVHMTTGIPLIYGIVVLTIFFLAFLFRKKLIQTRKFNRVLIAVAYLNALFTIIGVKHSIISRFTVLLEIPVIVILLVDGVFFEISKVLIWIFLLLLTYESFSSSYTESRIFIMLTLLLLLFIFVINQCIPLSTYWGFGFYELKYALFTLPLQSLPWLNEYTFILFSLNFYLIGYLIKKFKGAAKA